MLAPAASKRPKARSVPLSVPSRSASVLIRKAAEDEKYVDADKPPPAVTPARSDPSAGCGATGPPECTGSAARRVRNAPPPPQIGGIGARHVPLSGLPGRRRHCPRQGAALPPFPRSTWRVRRPEPAVDGHFAGVQQDRVIPGRMGRHVARAASRASRSRRSASTCSSARRPVPAPAWAARTASLAVM